MAAFFVKSFGKLQPDIMSGQIRIFRKRDKSTQIFFSQFKSFTVESKLTGIEHDERILRCSSDGELQFGKRMFKLSRSGKNPAINEADRGTVTLFGKERF